MSAKEAVAEVKSVGRTKKSRYMPMPDSLVMEIEKAVEALNSAGMTVKFNHVRDVLVSDMNRRAEGKVLAIYKDVIASIGV